MKELRAPRGYKTARKLAAALGIDENRYTRYERAEVEPDLSMLVRICETLGITPNELFGIADPSSLETAPGFGESSKTGDLIDTRAEASVSATSRADESSSVRNGMSGKRRAMTWQLARELALAEAGLEPSAARTESAIWTVQRTSRLFSEIEADPFAFVARTVETPPLTALDRKAQAKIVALMDKLIEAVNRAELG